jgi:glyoxylase-like metal-dependent hydrolase (beta-lactamase superfamily II)
MKRSGLLIAFCLIVLAPAALADAAPGYARTTVGAFKVTALRDGSIDLVLDAYKGLPAAEIKALAERSGELKSSGLPTSVNAYLVDTGAHKILVDAGNAHCYGWALGGLEGNLRAAGYRPEQIDLVLLTHLHGDHVCGLVQDGKKLFPNATIYAAQEEADAWLEDAPQTDITAKQARETLALYGKAFHTFHTGAQLAPGVTIVPAHGHTAGHTAYRFRSKGQSLLVWGDIVHCPPVQFLHPEVSVRSDTAPAEAIATRQALFAQTAKDDTLVAGAHLPFPGLGHLRREGDGYAWVALPAP